MVSQSAILLITGLPMETFEGTEVHSANGDIGIITERDRNGNITGLKQMEIPELTDFLEKSWKEK